MHFPRTLGLLLAVSSVAHARPAFSPDGAQRFGRYEILTSGDPAGGGLTKARAVGLLDATPDEVFRVATDYARYTEFAPRVVSADVVDRQGDQRAFVMMKTNLPWPVSAA